MLSLFKRRLEQIKTELTQKGSLVLSSRDKDRFTLWSRLKNPSDNVTKYLTSQLSSETRNLLSSYPVPFRSDNAEARLGHAFIEDLNRIIRSGPIYTEERFAGVKLSAEASRLLNQKPEDADLVRLNIALLLDAYRQGLWRDPDLEREKPLLELATKEGTGAP